MSNVIEKYKIKFAKIFEVMEVNIKPLLLFVVLFAIFNIYATTAILSLFGSIIAKISNTTYLGPDNIVRILLNPGVLVCLFFEFVLLSILAVFEIAGIIYTHSMSINKKKVTLRNIISAGINACERGFLPRNWLIFIFVMVIIPLTGVISFASTTICVEIPSFILEFLLANKLYATILIIVYILLLIYVLKRIFAFNSYIFENKNFREACIESDRIVKGKRIETIICLIISAFFFYIVSTAISGLLSDIIIKISSAITNASGILTNSYNFSRYMPMLKKFMYAVFSPIINIATLTVLFYEYIGKTNEEIDKVCSELTEKKFTIKKILTIIISILLVIAYMGYLYRDMGTYIMKDNERPQIVAHRGDSVRAPENTMPAFKLAAKELTMFGEDAWVEFDVHETKDGVIVVSHDDNLSRVSGKNVCMHELTYAEAESLDVGSWFGDEFSYVRFSTLDEVLKFYKDYENITLQIELKPTYYDVELEEKVLKIINDNEMHDRCIVTSLKLEPLKRMKELDKTMITTYSMFIASDSIYDIKDIDYFTIEMNNVNPALINNIHKQGKKCFAWTVNTEDSVQDLVDSNIDGILTDDPIMMFNALDKVDYDGGIKKVIRFYLRILFKGL